MTRDEFMDLVGADYVDEYEKAQPSQEGTTKDTTFSCGHENDTISRQAAVELVMEYCPDDDGAVQCDGDIRELLDELENLPSAQPEQRWIPCSERFPEDCKDVLITYTCSFELTCPQETAKLLKGAKTVSGNPIDPKVLWEVPFADYIAFYDVDEKRWFSPTDNPEPFPDEIKVIAWMPLPEPYKAEAERRTE